MKSFPLTLPAIRVEQPLGEFFVVSLDALTLRTVTFLDPTRINRVDRTAFWYSLLGAQRESSPRRAKQIAKYINTYESAFPNSIILAANYVDYGELQEDETKRWRVESVDSAGFQVIIPSSDKMASVVDGQHRLLGFDYCNPERKAMELLCSIYMDLPYAYQAYLFATININQRKVDKSLAYDQFGYNLDEEQHDSWAPDKLAVYFGRKLNLDAESPFYGCIKVAPMNAESLFPEGSPSVWQVSMACLVEGIAKLISQNPKQDRDLLHVKPPSQRFRSILTTDSSPYRHLYLANEDDALYEQIVTFFKVAQTGLWAQAIARSYIRKTVGIQALFDVLRACVGSFGAPLSKDRIEKTLIPASKVDFSDAAFQASGKGRSRIKNTLLLYAGLVEPTDLPPADKTLYSELRQKYPSESETPRST